MGQTIKHFMWGYQIHFRAGINHDVDNIFSSLDKRFQPEIFLVGILVDEHNERRFPACVEPENDFWALSEDFNNVLQDAQNSLKNDPEKNLFHTHPLAQKYHDTRIFKRAVKNNIYKCINENKSRPEGMSYFTSIPQEQNGYLVSIVIGLQTDVLSNYKCLQKTQLVFDEYHKSNVQTSFVESVIQNYLNEASKKLLLPDPGCDVDPFDTDDILLRSAKDFAVQLSIRTNPQKYEAWYGVFKNCNAISSSYYEKATGKGTIVLARKEHHCLVSEVKFLNPINLSNTKGARKLLQLASNDLSLHCDGQMIYGLVKIQDYHCDNEDVFVIKFVEHYHWEISHAEQTLMRVKYGRVHIPKAKFDEYKLRSDLFRIFDDIKKESIDQIVDLVNTAVTEQHGTMLLISSNAENEAKRLKTQSILIEPQILTPEILKTLTPIDGAVILAPNGTCYAIGAILDGIATEKGNSSRGARFNSAIRYIEASHLPAIAIIVSEDGDVDFVPDLKSAIDRKEIDQRIKRLQVINKNEKISRESYYRLRNWLDNHRFYLLPEDCEIINILIKKLDEKLQTQDNGAINIILQPFEPNDEFNKKLYYQ